jgi:hypothetical protein
MKLAVLLFGMSKCENKHFYHPIKYSIDYSNSYANYKEFIFDFFSKKGYDIDVYFATNHLEDKDRTKLCDTYNPVRCSFVEDDPYGNNNVNRNKRFNKVIDLCMESGIQYDLILITRFDLLFQKDFNTSNIELDKFNLVSILEVPHGICDNFYLFPYHFFQPFSTIVKRNLYKSFHWIQSELYDTLSKSSVNYILNEHCQISELSFYKIVRNVSTL